MDEKTNYVTKNLLVMPIQTKDEVLGVVQMINKVDGDCFTAAGMLTSGHLKILDLGSN